MLLFFLQPGGKSVVLLHKGNTDLRAVDLNQRHEISVYGNPMRPSTRIHPPTIDTIAH